MVGLRKNSFFTRFFPCSSCCNGCFVVVVVVFAFHRRRFFHRTAALAIEASSRHLPSFSTVLASLHPNVYSVLAAKHPWDPTHNNVAKNKLIMRAGAGQQQVLTMVLLRLSLSVVLLACSCRQSPTMTVVMQHNNAV